MHSAEEDVCYDIINCFPHEVCKTIFQHLTVKEILGASLVSRDWYNFVASTPACMRRIKLNFSYEMCQDLSTTTKEILMKSSRKYENVKFSRHSRLVSDVIEILESRSGWKKAEFTRLTFSTSSDCMKLLAAIEPDVEDLKMEIVLVDTVNEEDTNDTMSFPKLKVLQGKYIHVSIYCMALINVATLQEFRFSVVDHSPKSIEVTTNMLHRNKGLKKLTVTCDFLSTFFSENIAANIKFQLTSLDAQVIYNFTDTHKLHLKLFLESQMQCLETLNLGYWMGHEVLQMIFHMPKLTMLIFKGFHGGGTVTDWKEIKFHKNFTVTTLHLNEWNSQAEFLRTFFLALPNLKHLKLLSITDENLTCIAEAFPNLETLTSDLFEVSSIPEKTVLPKLQSFSAKAFKHNLQLEEGADQDCGNFARLVLDKIRDTPPPVKRPRMRLPVHNRHPFAIDE